MTDEELIEEAAKAIAKAANADYWTDEIAEWEEAEEWEREAHPDERPHMAYEDREEFRKQSRAAFAVFEKANVSDLEKGCIPGEQMSVTEPQAEQTRTLDPQPWAFVSDQVFGVRSATDKGFHSVSGAYYTFQPRAEYEQDRAGYVEPQCEPSDARVYEAETAFWAHKERTGVFKGAMRAALRAAGEVK